MSSVTGNLCNKCPKWLVEQNSSYSDYFNAISGFTSNSRAPGGPVTLIFNKSFDFEIYTIPCPEGGHCTVRSHVQTRARTGHESLYSESNASWVMVTWTE